MRSCCSDAPGVPAEHDHNLALLVEEHHAEAFAAERAVPGVEVHRDADVTWVVHPGPVWRNAAILVRFNEPTAQDRIDQLLTRYQRHGRGVAFWIAPAATPDGVSALLKQRGLRCQKHFPAMVRPLGRRQTAVNAPGLEIRRVESVDEFQAFPHPAIGPPNTELRRKALQRLAVLAQARQRQIVPYVAWLNGRPVGSSELFVGSRCAGVHSLNVSEAYQRRGIGTAMLEHVCRDAARAGSSHVALLASAEGQALYLQSGFREVARFAYWYRSFQRC